MNYVDIVSNHDAEYLIGMKPQIEPVNAPKDI